MSSSKPDPTLITQRAYEVDADVWAQARNDRAAIQPFVDRFVGLAGEGGRVLDVGCGPGFDTASLSEAGLKPVALDLAQAMARLAAARSHAAVVQSDARYLPFIAASFEGVWASASLIHISRQDIAVALQDIRRVLKQGGVLYSRMQVGDSEGVEQPAPGNPISQPRFFARYDGESWRALLTANGFDIVDQQEDQAAPGARRWLSTFARPP